MCGLAGWFGAPRHSDTEHGTIDRMLDLIVHRGPDGRGVTALPDKSGTLGHVRLAIIDPSGGQQPLWSADKRCVIVFNGEIYNYRELRDTLIEDGLQLRTHSDTEVVLELLRREGSTALSKLRGMFALAYWDGERHEGLLARDTLGIKPLFWRQDSDRLWFASEAKAFSGTPNWAPQLDCHALHLLLNFRYPATGHGLMRDVHQLAPGECLHWRAGVTRTSQFQYATPNQVSHTVREAILDSVRAHLVADVPVSCYLSGGVDSGIIATLAAEFTGKRIASFTIDAGDDPSELANARATAHWLGISNTAGALAPTTTQTLDWLLWHLEIPKINALQSAAVAQLAAGHTKVCLSGLGGDELFLGYRAHAHLATWHRACRTLGPAASPAGEAMSWLLAHFDDPFGERRRAAQMLAHAHHPAHAYALLRNVWDGSLPREAIYGPRMLDHALPSSLTWIEQHWPSGLAPVEAMATFEWRHKMVDDLLWQEDRVSMACGLEVRVPFVDAQLAASILPLRRNAQPGRKQCLREAFSSDLPAHILQRPKSGFQIDIATHLDTLFGAALEQWLSPELVRQHGLFNPAFVNRIKRLDRRKAHRWHFFMLLLMALSHRWLELFEQGNPPTTLKSDISRVLA